MRTLGRLCLPLRGLAAVAAVAAAALLAACTPGTAVDDLPGGLGLPAGTPARPAASYNYPAVHDMPPPRSTTPLSEQQQFSLERDLQAARDRQEGKPSAGRKAAPKRKTNAKDVNSGINPADNAGARANP